MKLLMLMQCVLSAIDGVAGEDGTTQPPGAAASRSGCPSCSFPLKENLLREGFATHCGESPSWTQRRGQAGVAGCGVKLEGGVRGAVEGVDAAHDGSARCGEAKTGCDWETLVEDAESDGAIAWP